MRHAPEIAHRFALYGVTALVFGNRLQVGEIEYLVSANELRAYEKRIVRMLILINTLYLYSIVSVTR